MEEVSRIEGLINAELEPTKADPRANAFRLAGILLPFADDNLSRDQYLAARDHLADAAKLAALEQRYTQALANAKSALAAEVKAAKGDGKTRPVDLAYRFEFRNLPGLPSGWVTAYVVRRLPGDLDGLEKVSEGDMKKLFAEALAEQRRLFQGRLDGLFAAARSSATGASPDRRASRDTRRRNIAKLLFGMTLTLSKEPVEAPGKAQAEQLRRVYVVCGLPQGVAAVSDRTEVLGQLYGLTESSVSLERQVFLGDLAYLVSTAREQAQQVRDEAQAVAENKDRKASAERLLKSRVADVEAARNEKKESIEQTDAQLRRLQALSDTLLRARADARDLLATMLEREKEIRRLEKEIRELQKKGR
jgi:hypothetical protein